VRSQICTRFLVPAILMALSFLVGCSTVSNTAPTNGAAAEYTNQEKIPPTNETNTGENTIVISVRGQNYAVKTESNVSPEAILIASGEEGFYWALPQDATGPEPGKLTEAAVIHYTPYSDEKVIEQQKSKVVYRLPIKDISQSGTKPGVLRLTDIQLRGKWLFYFFQSEIGGTSRPVYVALGVMDISANYPQNTARFLYRGHNTGGRQVNWTANDNFVVWQQSYPDNNGGYQVTPRLYDLKTGKQQALPLPQDKLMRKLILDGQNLVYGDASATRTLGLPAPGSDKLVREAQWLPSVAFEEAVKYISDRFDGTIYLPAAVNPAPFYRVTVEADTGRYQVRFDASDHPVPLNATETERRQLGVDPSLAQTLGTITVSRDENPPWKKQGDGALPQGQSFPIKLGKRTLAAHFVADSFMVWWQDGSWRFRLNDYARLWESPDDPLLQQAIRDVLDELPPNGQLVPDGREGEVHVNFAPDHRGTEVYFRQHGEWIQITGYNYDAIRGAQQLVTFQSSAATPERQVITT